VGVGSPGSYLTIRNDLDRGAHNETGVFWSSSSFDTDAMPVLNSDSVRWRSRWSCSSGKNVESHVVDDGLAEPLCDITQEWLTVTFGQHVKVVA